MPQRRVETDTMDAFSLRPRSSAPRESAFVRRRLFSVLHVGILLCLLLPFVTVGGSCSTFETKPLTGVELVTGKDPEIASSDPSVTYPSSDTVSEIQSRYDVARSGAIALLVFASLALVVVIWPHRETAKVAIVLTLLSLVALAVVFNSTVEGGDAEIGLGLAYLFVLATLAADVFVFRRLGGRVGPAGAVLLVLAVPASQAFGLVLGSAMGP